MITNFPKICPVGEILGRIPLFLPDPGQTPALSVPCRATPELRGFTQNLITIQRLHRDFIHLFPFGIGKQSAPQPDQVRACCHRQGVIVGHAHGEGVQLQMLVAAALDVIGQLGQLAKQL